ncbi:MAG TPA: gluconokinase [Dongiaceae bacterium]|nr:gluconokinase [Dongiaceae bacterium]
MSGASKSPLSKPHIFILMGVSGCGKSTIAHLLANELGWPMLEGDEFHSLGNIAKMRAGIPLTDADRQPWLDAIAERLAAWHATGTSGLVTCSALKRHYRARLVANCPEARFIYLKGAPDLIQERLVKRLGHFMPTNLLASQFAALEEPRPEERAIAVSAVPAPADIVAEIVKLIPSVA